MTDAAKQRRDEWIVRIGVLALATFFGYSFIFRIIYQMRTEYWLSVDGKKTTALIEKEFGQGAWYKYSVDGKEYQNESQRNWDPDVGVGHESVVFFSSSHPWLSSLTTPRFEPAEAVVLFFAFPVELLLIVTVLSPRSPWAMKILQKCESKDKT